MREYDDNQPAQEYSITPPKPNYTLSFNKDGKQVGAMDFNGPTMTFEGDADASAKIFIDSLSGAFAGRLSEEYLRGRTDALADHGISGGK